MYVLGEELGRGGMGAVFVGEHTVLKRRVAIKLLLGEHTSDTDMRTRFLREARAVARLHHPNLVPVIDFGELEGGTPYFVSELVGGESMRSRLKREGSLPVNRAVGFAIQIARGLACAHAAGIVHRDLKPSNVMLVGDAEAPFGERVKILDFGVAKISKLESGDDSELTQTGALVGTPGFMSPEQCRGVGEVDHRSDIYSLGVLLYMMLAGRPTFVGDGLGEVLAMHIYLPPNPLSDQFNDVPRELDRIILKCLAKKPVDRQASMHDLIADLERLGTLSARPLVPAASPSPHRSLALALPAPSEPRDKPARSRAALGSNDQLFTGGDLTVDTVDDLPSGRSNRTFELDADLLAPYESPETVVSGSAALARPRRRSRGRLVGLALGLVAAGAIAGWMSTGGNDLELPTTAMRAPGLSDRSSAPTAAATPSAETPSAATPSAATPSAATPSPSAATIAPQPARAISEPPAAVPVPSETSATPIAVASQARPARPLTVSRDREQSSKRNSRVAARAPKPTRVTKAKDNKDSRTDLPRSGTSDGAPAARDSFERPVF